MSILLGGIQAPPEVSLINVAAKILISISGVIIFLNNIQPCAMAMAKVGLLHGTLQSKVVHWL